MRAIGEHIESDFNQSATLHFAEHQGSFLIFIVIASWVLIMVTAAQTANSRHPVIKPLQHSSCTMAGIPKRVFSIRYFWMVFAISATSCGYNVVAPPILVICPIPYFKSFSVFDSQNLKSSKSSKSIHRY